MWAILTKLLLVIILFPGISYGIESSSQESIESVLYYRCELINKYHHLNKISREFGDILLTVEPEKIFLGAGVFVDTMDEMKQELETIEVPKQMKNPYYFFLESIKAYRQSAEYIHTAMGILLGYNDGTTIEAEEIIDQSVNYVVLANKYLGLSIVMDGELIEVERQGSGECKKYVGKILNQDSPEVRNLRKM